MQSDSDFDFEPAPECFRSLFTGQALTHLDEMVLSWRMGGHPIDWTDSSAIFQVHLCDGPTVLFRLYAPCEGNPAQVGVDTGEAAGLGVPEHLIKRLWDELAFIGKQVENTHVPLCVSLAKFSRGDRKVFLAYALTIARTIAVPPELP
jgi:hypothetical protein